MATVEISIAEPSYQGIADADLTAVSSGNDYTLEVKKGHSFGLYLRSTGNDATLTLKSSYAALSGQYSDDVALTVDSTTDHSVIGPIDTSRFKDTDGKVHFIVGASTEGGTIALNVAAFEL